MVATRRRVNPLERRAVSGKVIEICILAGGLSTRMGRDKAALRLGGRSMLRHVRASALKTGRRVRVIRRDQVPRCGPLGGVVTALRTSKARAVLFLACDMPLVSESFLKRLIHESVRGARSVFVNEKDGVGFPFVVRAVDLPQVEQQLARGEFSLQKLAATLKAGRLRTSRRSRDLFNVNTPRELAEAEALLRRRESRK